MARRNEFTEYREIWRDEIPPRSRLATTRYFNRNVELFTSLPGILDEPYDERQKLFKSYTRHMVMGRSGGYRRNDPRNPFWREIGIHPSNFDWAEFRAAMGYKRRG